MHRVLNTWTKVWTGHHSKICIFKYTAYVTFPLQDGPKISSGHHSRISSSILPVPRFANAGWPQNQFGPPFWGYVSSGILHMSLRQCSTPKALQTMERERRSLPPLPSLPLSPPNPSPWPSLLLLTTCIWKHSRTRANIHSFQYIARFI